MPNDYLKQFVRNVREQIREGDIQNALDALMRGGGTEVLANWGLISPPWFAGASRDPAS
jgi:hypothetical protein